MIKLIKHLSPHPEKENKWRRVLFLPARPPLFVHPPILAPLFSILTIPMDP